MFAFSARLVAFVCVVGAGASALAQYRSDRPVRGAWLRPPSTVAALEPYLQNMAKAGLTDLYLETFYWGVSTGKQGVFNSRYGYDYLAQAIPMAARYGIRMHAWIESGYWQYGSTGSYNFTSHPEWRVINITTNAVGGDQASQVFVNLCHPDVQAKLRAYCAELAAYPGLWSVQTDYHRMPIDNNTSDVYTAPWSYESWTNTAFQAVYGASADIFTTADQPGKTNWNRFLTWRKAGISEAARQEYLGVKEGRADATYSASVFANPETSKCQDWPAWCTGNYVDQVIPMAYGTTTSSIGSDLTTTISKASGKKVIAGLYVGSGHPTIPDQLTACKSKNVNDFVFFEASIFGTASNQTDVTTWLGTNNVPMRADLNGNGVMDQGDWDLLLASYHGTSTASTSSVRMNLDANTVLDSADNRLMRNMLAKYRLNDQGVWNTAASDALNAARTSAPASGVAVNNVYDFNLDGVVNDADQQSAQWAASTLGMLFVNASLQNTTLGSAGRTASVEFRDANTNALLQSLNLPTDAAGFIRVVPPQSGAIKISVKASHWLRKAALITAGATDQVVNLALTNGDVVPDNTVDASDYFVLSDAYETSTGDPAYVAAADLNEDGTVDASDYFILSDAYELTGD